MYLWDCFQLTVFELCVCMWLFWNSVFGTWSRSVNFRDFIAKCLVKDPDARPTMGELLEVGLFYWNKLRLFLLSFFSCLCIMGMLPIKTGEKAEWNIETVYFCVRKFSNWVLAILLISLGCTYSQSKTRGFELATYPYRDQQNIELNIWEWNWRWWLRRCDWKFL